MVFSAPLPKSVQTRSIATAAMSCAPWQCAIPELTVTVDRPWPYSQVGTALHS